MNRSPFLRAFLPLAVVASLSLGPVIAPMALPGLLPDAEAAGSRDKRTIKKLKKETRGLRKTVNNLRRDLAGTRRELDVALAGPPFIEMVTVGNPGNAADSTGYGAVAETFQIGKYEVTNAQYAEFLNAVGETDTNGLFDASMETNARGGIDQFGSSGSFRYAVRAGMGDKPVIYVSFWDACRFCNWLHNGMPSGLQDAFTTETGAYNLTTPGAIAANTVTRSPGAQYFIPTEDQWYKAAYHQPAASGGDVDDYWLYPTMSNTAPTVGTVNAIGEITNDDENIANYNNGANWDSNGDEANENGNVTTVGSGGPGSMGFYGAFDMGGNVREWNEAIFISAYRGYRGGSCISGESRLRSSSQPFVDPTGGGSIDIGFRVASP